MARSSLFLILCVAICTLTLTQASQKKAGNANNHPITQYLRKLQDATMPELGGGPVPVATFFPTPSPTGSPTGSPTTSPTLSPTKSPSECPYSCPMYGYSIAEGECPESIDDCRCEKGWKKYGDTCESCNTFTCGEFSVPRDDKQCVRSQRDCACIRGFRFRAKKCRYCDNYKCPGVYEPRPDVQCIRRFRHCYVPPKEE